MAAFDFQRNFFVQEGWLLRVLFGQPDPDGAQTMLEVVSTILLIKKILFGFKEH